MRKTEVAGIARILEDPVDVDGKPYETPEDAAKAIIKWLDEDRAKRKSYAAVMQFGHGKAYFYVGLGPYPGAASAEKAAREHPAAAEAYKIAVVPLRSPEGLKDLLEQVGR